MLRLTRLAGSTRPTALYACIAFALIATVPVARAQTGDGSRITLDRIFTTPDFQEDGLGPVHWFPGGAHAAYTMAMPTGERGPGADIVRFDAATGTREVLVPASKLTPPGAAALEIENYEWSPDGTRLLVFTNSRRVWRQNTRGDY